MSDGRSARCEAERRSEGEHLRGHHPGRMTDDRGDISVWYADAQVTPSVSSAPSS